LRLAPPGSGDRRALEGRLHQAVSPGVAVATQAAGYLWLHQGGLGRTDPPPTRVPACRGKAADAP